MRLGLKRQSGSAGWKPALLVMGIILAMFVGWTAHAQPGDTNADLADQIPALKPPRGEIPPGFWEQNGGWIVALGALGLFLGGAAVWFFSRPKQAMAVPPEVEAREALKLLANEAEDGQVLSRISRVVKRYFAAAFGLPGEELTTTEFARVMAAMEKIGPDLAERTAHFLRQCDERKFAAENSTPAQAALPIATKLIDLAEERRGFLREREKAEEAKAV